MKTVVQSDKNGCWLACVSMLTKTTYKDLRSRYKFQDEVTGRAAGPIVKLLDSLGYDCEAKSTPIKKLGNLAALDTDALVYFKNVDADGDECGGHWMVWDQNEKAIRDPEGWKAGSCFKIKNFRRVRAR